jgi:DnaJ-class molecular chaperone
MFDSLKIFDLGYAASYAEVKAKYRAMARIYHPDQHNPERTVLTHSQAEHLFKLINNTHEYLRTKLWEYDDSKLIVPPTLTQDFLNASFRRAFHAGPQTTKSHTKIFSPLLHLHTTGKPHHVNCQSE